MSEVDGAGRILSFFDSVTFGETVIPLLADTPEIVVESEILDSFDYPDSAASESHRLLRRSATVKVRTKDVVLALALVGAFADGDELAAPERIRPLTLTPRAGAGGRKLVFPAAWLLPELSYRPELAGEHTATLRFAARSSGGVLYSYA